MLDTKAYEDKVYRIGKVSIVAFIISTFAIPLVLWLNWGLLPTKEGFISGASVVLAIMLLTTISEFLSFAPIVGAAGYFVMMLSGNLTNIKIPSSVVALETAELEASSEEGDAISTMAIAASALTTEVCVFAGVLMLAPFTSFFAQENIKAGFEQIVPALFSALLLSAIIAAWKTTVIPLVVGFVVVKLNLADGLYNIPLIIFITVVVTIGLFKAGVFNDKKKPVADTMESTQDEE